MADPQNNYNTDDTIFALATPPQTSAISIIRISGTQALTLFAPLFSRPQALAKAQGNTILHGYIVQPQDNEPIDEILLSVFRAPQSYTGEDGLEINCHGSVAIQQKILELLNANHFRPAAAGEFTYRAFLNKRIDLTEAEAVHELITASSEGARRLALNRLNGSIKDTIATIKTKLLTLCAHATVQLDYPEEDLDEDPLELDLFSAVEQEVSTLLLSYNTGRLHQEGVRIVLCGKTNAGKSSLFNLFLKQERSIVSPTAGTTRDYIESSLSMQDILVKLYDTAGFRESDDQIEQEGINRTQALLDTADLILYLVDSTQGMTEHEQQLYQQHKDSPNYLFLSTKTDLAQPPKAHTDMIAISASDLHSFHHLEQAILKRLALDTPPQGPVIESVRQKQSLQQTLAATQRAKEAYQNKVPLDLLVIDLQEAIDALSLLTGEITNDEVLDVVFSQFCLGK